MLQSLQDILSRQWWDYDPSSTVHVVYHWFNVAEGALWCFLGVIVARRFLLNQRSLWEVAYAVAFFLFGIGDFVEAQGLYTWLIVYKALILVLLILLRGHVLKRHYPDSHWI
ncbi:hypothetical protein Mal52_47610 [Symmachiella dynata]|uniref:Uncharacterized protein n=1 Tax=Symmachiella dynata TaxID=2527995 RepID=A0A517ZUT4_9PLAN|nr:hypothetical protein [Symmachiella dynata]QDU46243.1 hypothetical protein Mal52_47610 [Symmachiella dynata]